MASILHDQINLRQTSPNTYSISWHADWVLGTTLNGGCLASCVHHAAITHLTTDPTLAARDQPDILSLHVEFLRPCEPADSTITIVPLKVGSTACTLQLQLSQNGRLCILALATTTNFEKSLGPTAPTDWAFHPQPCTKPNFDLIDAHKPEPNWVGAILKGEFFAFTHRLLCVGPRAGFPTAGICDAWYRFLGDERIDTTYIGLMADVIPSMGDTLLHNGLFDGHSFYAKAVDWATGNPGVPAEIVHDLAAAMGSERFSVTASLNLEFRKRIPKEGLQWVFIRTATKSLQGGRMGVDITICEENMDLVCEAHQLILVLEAQRKFYKRKSASVL